MKAIAYDLLGALLAITFGFLIGWHCKGVSVQAGEVRATTAEMTTLTSSVTKQAAAQTQQMQVQQDQTVGLMAKQAAIRTDSTSIQSGIFNATFAPRTVIKVVPGVCPDTDPVGSDDFERLYDGAAKGSLHPAAAASAATG